MANDAQPVQISSPFSTFSVICSTLQALVHPHVVEHVGWWEHRGVGPAWEGGHRRCHGRELWGLAALGTTPESQGPPGGASWGLTCVSRAGVGHGTQRSAGGLGSRPRHCVVRGRAMASGTGAPCSKCFCHGAPRRVRARISFVCETFWLGPLLLTTRPMQAL